MNGRALPILAIVIGLVILFGYVRPSWSGPVKELRTAIANDNEALAAAEAYRARQGELASARATIADADLSRLTNFLPDTVNNVGIILDLDALAGRSGLSIVNIDVAAEEESNATAQAPIEGVPVSPVGSVDLSLSALGSYQALQTFLQSVERSVRLLDVLDLTVEAAPNGVYEYNMTLRLYWLR